MLNSVTDSSADDAANQITAAEYGEHCLIIYPDLATLRLFYSVFTKRQIEANGTILIALFYETANQVRQILSDKNSWEVSKYENQDILTIMDSMESYFGKERTMYSINEYVTHAQAIGKKGFSAVADVGVFILKNRIDELVQIELTLPIK